MPGYTKTKRWIYSDTVGKLYQPKHAKGFSRLKAAWRGRKERKNFRGNQRGYLTKGKFTRSY